MTLRKFLKLWAPQATPEMGAEGARNMGRRRRPTFPLSNFKTKHILGILMTLRQFLKLWSTEGSPNFCFILFFYRRRRRRQMGTESALNVAPKAQ